MKVSAPAKINWDLRILGRRPDGYHELDTVMVTIGLADELTLEPAPDLTLTCSDPALPCDGRNLIVQAAAALAAAAGLAPRARLHVEKAIPAGGGLGGGSSDAAATLVALNQLWNLRWPRERLADLAAGLGSDVAYFLQGGWCRCRGRGEIVEPLPGMERTPPVRLFLVLPELSVPTPAVYRALSVPIWDGKCGMRSLTSVSSSVNAEVQQLTGDRQVVGWPNNHLMEAAQRVERQLVQIVTALQQLVPGRWQMSGSGAVHFIVPPTGTAVEELEKKLRERMTYKLRVVETVTVTPRCSP